MTAGMTDHAPSAPRSSRADAVDPGAARTSAARPGEPSPGALLPGALLTEEQTRWLRRAVVGMTAILVAGVALLIGRVIYLARGPGTQAASGPADTRPLLPQVRLDLPAGATITSVSVTGARLAVLYALPDGNTGIRILDLSTGQVISRVTIEATP